MNDRCDAITSRDAARHRWLAVGASVLSVVLSACGAIPGDGMRVGAGPYTRGSGTLASESRSVGLFHELSAAEGIAVVLSPGPSSLTVTADDNLLSHVVTSVEDGVLRVEVDGSVQTDTPFSVAVVTPNPVDRLAASTGARIEADGLDADALAVEVNTGGRIQAGGRSGSLRVDAQAGGSAELEEIVARDASVSIGSGSTATVYATGALTGSLTGGSTLRVLGGGRISDVSVDGSSSLVRR